MTKWCLFLLEWVGASVARTGSKISPKMTWIELLSTYKSNMAVSENSGIHLVIGFSIIFTIHFWGPIPVSLFLGAHPGMPSPHHWGADHLCIFLLWLFDWCLPPPSHGTVGPMGLGDWPNCKTQAAELEKKKAVKMSKDMYRCNMYIYIYI